MAPRVDLPGPLGFIDIPPFWRKPCSVNHWGWGVEVAATPRLETGGPFLWTFQEMPIGVAPDGDGGAFVLVVVSRKGTTSRETTCSFDVSIVSGDGRPPPLAPGKSPARRKTARR